MGTPTQTSKNRKGLGFIVGSSLINEVSTRIVNDKEGFGIISIHAPLSQSTEKVNGFTS